MIDSKDHAFWHLTCPRCEKQRKYWSNDKDLVCHCGLGIGINGVVGASSIKLGDYLVIFQSEQTVIYWNQEILVEELDYEASVKELEETYGESWEQLPKATIVQHRKTHIVARNEQQQLTIPSLRWKITVEDIEKLLILR